MSNRAVRESVRLRFTWLGQRAGVHANALYKGGVELPTDYDGVLWVELDSADGWKLQLAREMKAAGLDFDINKAV